MESQHGGKGNATAWPLIKKLNTTLPFFIAAILVLYNSIVNLVPQAIHDQIYIPANLAVVALVVVVARRIGLSWVSLGLVPQRPWRTTLRWGLGVGMLLPAPLFLMLALPESLTSLAEPSAEVMEGGLLLAYQALVRIPLGTALTEEVLFRGVLYGVWNTVGRARTAIIWSSVAFGLWHIVPALELLQRIGQFDLFLLASGVIGGVVAAFLGGLLFCWLRIRCGSAYASILAHWLINALSLVALFLVQL
jgi:membrane protease YdiL (CAAX protease family)